MTKLNLARLKKDELVYMATHRCKHSHTYISHITCYMTEHKDETKIGFVDIEATHLTADMGIILTWAVKAAGGDIIRGRITRDDMDDAGLSGREDKRIVQELVDTMNQFDQLVGYYSTKYDIPFIRTRAVIDGIQFPIYGTLKHNDAYYTSKFKFNLLSHSQENTARALLGRTAKTKIEWKLWRAAARGNEKALDYVQEHNDADVKDLEEIYFKSLDYTGKRSVSI